MKLRVAGRGMNKIAKELGIGISTVKRVLNNPLGA